MDFPLKLIQLLRITNRVAALTGAGASQESGLRTFRDSQAGLWAQYKPEDLASPQAFAPLVSLESFSETSGVARDPKLIWDWYAWWREAVKGVRPNAGHYALAEIEKHISEFTIITQNVDGLHRMAGNQNVLELHGNIQRVRCSECYTFTETWGDDTESVPQCEVLKCAADCCALMLSGSASHCRAINLKPQSKPHGLVRFSFRLAHRELCNLLHRSHMPHATAVRWWLRSTLKRRRSHPRQIISCKVSQGRSCRSW